SAARERIIDYIGRRFQRHRLADVVGGVLNALGYQTRISPPGPDGGVDILAGHGPLGLDPPHVCVQVKSGAARVCVEVLRALEGATGRHGQNAQGLLVSWNGWTQQVDREAREHHFKTRLWGKEELVNAVLSHYERLPADLRTQIPLKRIWTLAVEDE